ncbi:hypothetical protein D3C86_1888750 [compost metagenome]
MSELRLFLIPCRDLCQIRMYPGINGFRIQTMFAKITRWGTHFTGKHLGKVVNAFKSGILGDLFQGEIRVAK